MAAVLSRRSSSSATEKPGGRFTGKFAGRGKPRGPAPEAKILYQTFFKSVGPRTYAAQLKEAGNGNHFVVLTEGKRDDKTGEVKKTKLFVFSEDFDAFRDLLRDTFTFINDHPMSEEIKAKRAKFWAKENQGKSASVSQPASVAPRPN